MATASSSSPSASQGMRVRAPRPVVTIILALACAAAFAASHLFGNGLDEPTLVACGAKHRDLILRSRQWWRLLSAGFLHANLVHLLVNLYALISLGRIVEALWGHRRFLILYSAALLGGSLASLAATPGVSVGASGAVFGLFGALFVIATVHREHLAPKARRPLLVNLAAVLAINVALGLTVPFIDNAAHMGGLAAGALASLVVRPVKLLGRAHPLGDGLAALAAAAAAAALAASLALAARNARASEWLRILGGEFQTHTLERGELIVSVPRDWSYEAPRGTHGHHVFARPGLAVVAVRLMPQGSAADTRSAAFDVQAEWLKAGAQLAASREIAVGDRTGAELLLRRRASGRAELHRIVIFPANGGRLVYLDCACLESRYPLMEVLFDRILHGIRAGPPGRPATIEERVWDKVADDPKNPDAAAALAARYAREGRPDQAERLLLASLRRHPRHAETHNQLALFYATARSPHANPQEAVRLARKALELAPDTPRYLATLALACEAAGDPSNALAAARRAAELAPDDAAYADLARRLAPSAPGPK